MVLFYAWTNVVLLNIVNTKETFFDNEDADLLVRCSPTLSPKLISDIESMGIFNNVYYIDMPKISKTRKILGKIPKIRMIGMKKPLRKFYVRYVQENLANKAYSKIITGGLWNDTLYLLQALYSQNPKIQIEFVEEGERSYEGIKGLCKPIIGGNWKNKLVEYYNVGLFLHKCKRNITNVLYLYRPDRYCGDHRLCLKELPKIDKVSNNPCFLLLDKMSDTLDNSILLRYEKRPVIYIANYLVPKFESNYDMAYRIIDLLIKVFKQNQIMIKTHTSATEHRFNFAKQYESRIFIDRNAYLFEALYTKMDINNKIFIAKNSTTLLYPKQLFGQEPYLIFTYRLFEYYHEYGDEITDKYVSDLKKIYENPEKIFIPNTMMELENQLRSIYKSILDNKYKGKKDNYK